MKSHVQPTQALSAGIKSLLVNQSSFAHTQAAWRFLNNDRCTLAELVKPLLVAAKEGVETYCDEYALSVHDWSGLSYKTHDSKADRYGIHNKQELGYELQSSVLISDRNGSPIAPLALNLASHADLYSTYGASDRSLTHLEELSDRAKYIDQLGLSKPVVHIIDREATQPIFLDN